MHVPRARSDASAGRAAFALSKARAQARELSVQCQCLPVACSAAVLPYRHLFQVRAGSRSVTSRIAAFRRLPHFIVTSVTSRRARLSFSPPIKIGYIHFPSLQYHHDGVQAARELGDAYETLPVARYKTRAKGKPIGTRRRTQETLHGILFYSGQLTKYMTSSRIIYIHYL